MYICPPEEGGAFLDKHDLFAKNLSAIQKINGRSLGEFAQEIGIPKSTLQSALETGNIMLDTAIRISDGLNVPLDELLSDGQLARRLDVLERVLQYLEWFSVLPAADRQEVSFHLRKILEVMCK